MDVETIDQEIASMFADAESAPVTEPETPVTENTETAETTTTTASASEDASQTADTNNDSETNNQEVNPTTQTSSDEDKQTFSAEDKFNKQNRAFAEMRIKNKAQEEFLVRMANMAGLNVKNADEAISALSPRIQQVEAKQKNMDPEVLKELEDSRKQISEMRKEKVKNSAIQGFSNLKALHGLSDKELDEFADTLIAAHKNPFEQEMDLVAEYRLANFDKLIEKAREAGRAEEIARSKNAQASSTTPTAQRSPSNTGGSDISIKSQGDIDALFKSLGI
jgi:hypothetical protein